MKKNVKKVLSISLAVFMLLSSMPLSTIFKNSDLGNLAVKSNADFLFKYSEVAVLSEEEEAEEEEIEISDFSFSLNDDGNSYSVTYYFGYHSSSSVTIPSSYNGKPVTGVKGNTFVFHNEIKSITIPASVTTIGEYWISGCENLTNITVEDGNTAYSSQDGVLFNADKTELIMYLPTKTNTSYSVPSTVTSIKAEAFSDTYCLENITIPEGVKYIGDYAFYCSGIKSLTLPNSVLTIGEGAFYGCDALTTLTIGSGVNAIGPEAFSCCLSLENITVASGNAYFSAENNVLFNKSKTEIIRYASKKTNTSYTVPSSVIKITNSAFDYCENLTSVTLNNNITTIEDYAFYGCNSLTSFNIPSSLISFGNSVLSGCSSLSTITVAGGNTNYGAQDGVLFNYGKTELIFYPEGKAGTSYTVPSKVKVIGSEAFYNNTTLTTITLPTGLLKISNSAFCYCSELTAVTIPASVTEIGDTAFYGCKKMTTVVINSSGIIADSAFSSCNELVNLTIGSGITEIGEYAFSSCKKLETVTIPDTVQKIGSNAFSWCDKLHNITIPPSVTSIGNFCLNSTKKLTVHCVLNSTAHNYAISNGNNVEFFCTHANAVSRPEIPATCLEKGEEASTYCADCGMYLSGGEEIPVASHHKDSNGDGYCDWCSTQLSEILVGETTSIYVEAGEKTYIKFVPSVTGTYTFESFSDDDTEGYVYDETKTQELYWDSDSGTAWNFCVTCELTKNTVYYFVAEYYNPETDGSFDVAISLVSVSCEHTNTVSKAKINATCLSEGYEAGVYCNDCGNYVSGGEVIEQLDHIDNNHNNICDTCGTSFFDYEIKDGKASVTGYRGTLQSVVVPASIDGFTVTEISEDTFMNQTDIINITLPSTVNTIGDNAFAGCTNLSIVTIPSGVTSIGDSAFYNCYSLSSITLPDTVTSLGTYAFSNCGSLKTVSLGSGLTSIKDYTFQYCSSLENITIPEKVEAIGNYAFFGCYNLKTVTFNKGIKTIGEDAFEYCTSLQDVNIPNSVTSIGEYAFSECVSIEGISLPGSVTTVGEGTFSGCTNLSYVHLGSGLQSIGDYAFCECTSLKSLTVPRSVTSLGECFLQGCVFLSKLTIPFVGPDATTEKAVGQYNLGYFFGTDYYGYTENTEQYYYYDEYGEGIFFSASETYCIPKGLTEIGFNGTYVPFSAFYNCNNIKTVKFINGLTEIGMQAFYGCTKLTELNLPSTVKTLGEMSFFACSSLTEVVVPNSVTTMNDTVFGACTKLVSAVIPDSVTSFGYNMFINCAKLEKVTLGKGLTTIPNYCFYNCIKLNNVKIPTSVLKISEGAFAECYALNYIEIPNSVTNIHTDAFTNSNNTEIYGFSGTEAENFANDKLITFHPLDFITLKGEIDSNFPSVLMLNESKITDINDVVLPAPGYELLAEKANDKSAYYGTGSVFTVNGGSYNYIIVEGDLDGDGVCDVVDITIAEQLSNLHGTPTELQLFAANGGGEIDIGPEAYQNVVNCALAS